MVACLTTAFWGAARLGEVMVPNLSAFDPKIHMKRSDLGISIDLRGRKTTTIHVPVTKASRIEGEDLYWAKQDGASDPEEAMRLHLEINNPPASFHLFGYPNNQGTMMPMSKKTFTTVRKLDLSQLCFSLNFYFLCFPRNFLLCFPLLTYSQSFFSLSADHPRHSRRRKSKIRFY